VRITGQVSEGDNVKLYVNNAFADKVGVKADKSFSFDDVTLKEGTNTLKVKATKDNKESDYSDGIRIAYFSATPTLDLTSPADGRTFNHDQNPILVSGKTDPEANIVVNSHQAIMETDGKFQYTLNLNDGDNNIVIDATDKAGNKTEKNIKVILQ